MLLAVGSQASISICSWGLGALGPELRERFDLSAAQLGALLATVFLGNASVLVPAGALVDRVGPRLPLIVGGLASGGLLVAGAFAPNAVALGLALALFGISGAFVAVAGSVTVFHGFAADRRGMAMGVRQMAVSAGGLIAAALLPGLAALGGIGASLSASGVLAAVFATLFGLSSPRVARGDRATVPTMSPLTLLRIPGIVRVLGICLIHVAALAAVLNFAVPAIRDEGASAVVGSVLFAVISLSAVAGRLTWGRVADRDGGRRRWATLRDVGVVTVVGALGYWAAGPLGPAVQIPIMAVFAFGAMGANGLLHLLGGELAGPAHAGQALGLVSTALFGGGALASVPLGYLADRAGFAALWPTCAVLATGTVLLAGRAPERAEGR